jgi:hypothetical protein
MTKLAHVPLNEPPRRLTMCDVCKWQDARQAMMTLKSFRLASIDRWVEAKRCIANRQWQAIIKIAIGKDMLRFITVPEHMKYFVRDETEYFND